MLKRYISDFTGIAIGLIGLGVVEELFSVMFLLWDISMTALFLL